MRLDTKEFLSNVPNINHTTIYYHLTRPTLSHNAFRAVIVAIEMNEVIYIHLAWSAAFIMAIPLIITVFTVVPLSLTIRELMLPDTASTTLTPFAPTAP